MKLSQSYLRGETTEPLIYDTIGHYFDQITEQHGDKLALVIRHQSIRWNYHQYQQQVNRLAAGLLSIGIQAGDRVGIWAPNCVEWCLTQIATAKIGAIMVCINPAYRLYELEYALNKSGCKMIVSAERFKSSEYLTMLQQLAPELSRCKPGELRAKKLPALKWVVRMGEEETAGMINFSALCARGDNLAQGELKARQRLLQADDPINIQFTSGTTGSPKGATLTHFNILNNADQVAKGMALGSVDKLCIPVPLYHCFGMVMGSLVCITQGATAVFPSEAFDPLVTLETVAEEDCTALHGVPTMFIAELDHPRFNEFDLSSLRTGVMAGAPCPVEVMRRVISDMHMSEVTIMYGQTETSPVNHMTAIDAPIEKRVSTVGRCGPHQEVKLVNELGQVVPVGEKGELCCRGYSVMRGYWQDDERTGETIDNAGWLHSGDLAIMEKEGYVQIVGRLKDMIIRGGENIYPREVEEFLYQHPNIQDVQVFGIPHEKYGEEVCAWIKLKEGKVLNEEAVTHFCQGNITHFKIPSRINFVDEFPMTVTGKLQKFKMRDLMIKNINRC